MEIDRKKICAIISEMLDNGDKLGIYPTGKAYDELENYIMIARGEGIVPPERPKEHNLCAKCGMETIADITESILHSKPKEKCEACERLIGMTTTSHTSWLLNQHHTCEKKDA